jgi:hypothetical protein
VTAPQFDFDSREPFLAKLRELLDAGVPREDLRVRTPYHVPEAEALLYRRPGRLRYFPLFGGLAGFGGGMTLTIYSVLSWPIIVGGKPIVSVPPFLLISYLLVILFGSLSAFAGFLLLAHLPGSGAFGLGDEFSDRFVIVVEKEDSP